MAKNLFEFYVGQAANFLGRGLLHSRKGMSIIGVKPLYNKIITQKSVKRIIAITEFPPELNFNFMLILNKKVDRLHEGCKIFLNTDYYKSSLHHLVRTSEFTNELNNAHAQFDEYDTEFSKQSDAEKVVGKEINLSAFTKIKITKASLRRLEHVYESYKYVYKTITNQGRMLDGYSFVEVIGPDDKQCNQAFDTVYDALLSYGFGVMPVNNHNYKYLSKMSPSSFSDNPEKEKTFVPTILSTENIAFTQPYDSYGFIGDGSGTVIGINVGSNSPFILNFFKTADRQIILFLCPAGKGKTFQAMYIALFMINQGVHCSVIDVKGNEWNRMLSLVPGVEVDLLKSFINTARLDDIIDLVEHDSETAKMFYNSAILSTAELLYIMSGYSENPSQESIQASITIKAGVTMYFNSHNIVEYNFKSFIHTKEFTYKKIVDSFLDLLGVSTMVQHTDMIYNIINNCNSYLSTSGILDKKEITVRDVLDSPLVIYSLGRNQSQTNDPISESINSFMISYMDMKKIYIRKTARLQTSCFYEELQRSGEFARLVDFINLVVTGARSSNVTVFLLCNTPKSLMGENMAGVMSNISTFFIGPTPNEDDINILRKLGLSDIIEDVAEITADQEKYAHCFVSKFDTGDEHGTCIFSALATPELIELFHSRDTDED